MGNRRAPSVGVDSPAAHGTRASEPGRPEPSAVDECHDLALDTARMASWAIDAETGAVRWHAPIDRVLTVDPVVAVGGRPVAGPDGAADIGRMLLEPITAVLRSGGIWDEYRLEQEIAGRDGVEQLLLVRARRLAVEGRTVGCVGVVADVTEHRETERALREYTDRYQLLVELSPDGFVVHQEGKIVYGNRAGLALIGAEELEEVLGRSIVDFVDPESLTDTLERIATLDEEHPVSEPAEATLVRLDGAPWPVESVSVLTKWEGRPAYQVILRDLSERKKAEASLRYQARLVESVSDAIIGLDPEGRIESWNRAAETTYGRPAESVLGRRLHEVVGAPPGFGCELVEQLDAEHVRADGTPVAVRVSVAPIPAGSGRPGGTVVVCADVTERRRAEIERRIAETRYTAVVESLEEGIVVTDADGIITAVNPAARRILGHGFGPGDHCLEPFRPPDDSAPGDHDAPLHPALQTLHDGEPHSGIVVDVTRDGTTRWLSVNSRPLVDEPDTPLHGVVCSFSDITERRRAEHELSYRATHDALTGLCNRDVFLEDLDRELGRAARSRSNVAVLFVDIDRFKLVNDTFGHLGGDEVLVAVARRLRSTSRSTDQVGRLAGDEFVVLCPEMPDAAQAAARASELAEVLAAPIELSAGRRISPTVSVGVAFAAGGAGDAETLLRDADTAMYRAKELGRSRVELFDETLRSRTELRRAIEAELRLALERHEIEVHYQPIVSLRDGRLVGVEALARWHHATRGQISPVEFIPVAEETGLVVELGRQVLHDACEQAARWRQQGGPLADLQLSVNLSARQLADDKLVAGVATTLVATGLEADALCLEITESVLMDDAAGATRTLRELRELGVHLVIDDFGTGYSSLAYLRRFPVETLKIDRSFVDGLGDDPESEAIVRAVVGLARSLNLTVIAEGVEEEAQLEHLRDLDCDLVQGFYIARPAPAAALDSRRLRLAPRPASLRQTG